MFNGILWLMKTGAPWRDLPGEFGPWQSVYGRFMHWTALEVWQAILKYYLQKQIKRLQSLTHPLPKSISTEPAQKGALQTGNGEKKGRPNP